jgi:uncharacterized membrane protein
MIAIAGLIAILLFVAFLYYIDHRTRKEMKDNATKH